MFKSPISKTIFKNLGLILGTSIVGIIIFSFWLSAYTNHGQKIEVPQFEKLSLEAALELAESQNITIAVGDTAFVENVPANQIISQKPTVGNSIKEDRIVYVTINSDKPLMINMPNVTKMSLRQATDILTSHGLILGSIQYKPDFADNYVFEQIYRGRQIMPGSKIAKNSKIILVVGKGGALSTILIPNLVGLTYKDAITKISELGQVMSADFGDETFATSEDSLQAIVWKQTPMADSTINVSDGTSINIWLQKQ